MNKPTWAQRLLSSLALLAGVFLLSAPSWAGSPQMASPQQQAALQSLKQKAISVGSVRIIVGVALDASELAPGLPVAAQAAENRRLAVAQAQGKVLQRMDKSVVAKMRRLKHLPFLVVEADPAMIAALEQMPEVESISEDALYRPVLSESVPLVGANQAWDAGYAGNGEIIAILDTGVDKVHPFLAGKVVSEACYSTTSAPNSSVAVCASGSVAPGSGIPCTVSGCDHGTHVAGIASGNGPSAGVGFSGVAREASLAAIQVFSRFDNASICGGVAPCVLAYLSDITSGLDRAYELKMTGGLNVVAANLSLGGGSYSSQASCDAAYPAITAAIGLLRSIGLAAVIASGNDGSATGISHPGCVSTAVSVGATSKADVVASYSNSAPFLSLLAPGSSIYSSVPGGGFGFKSGTSMATPHVAGAWALMKDKLPAASVDEVLLALQNTGVPVLDSRNGITKPRIQVNEALGLNQPVNLTLTLSADNLSEVYVNGALVGATNDWQVAGVFSVALQPGPNVVAVKVIDQGGAAGLLADLAWDGQTAGTNTSWKVSPTAPAGWESIGFNDSTWPNATSYGAYGVAPWLLRVAGFPTSTLAQWIWTSDNQNVNQAYFRFTINVGTLPLAVDTTSLPNGTAGQAYSQQLAASGGTPPYTWSVVGGSLPPGVSLAANGTLSGVPSAAGASTFTVQVQDGNSATDTQVLSLTILPAPPASLALTLSADNAAEVYVNGALVGATNDWKVAGIFSVPLQPGPNVVAVKATDLGGAAALLADLAWDGQSAGTNSSWKVFPTAPPGWEGLGFDDSTWPNATSYGAYGVAPWLQNVAGFPTSTLAQWIWTSDNQNVNQAYFRFAFNVGSAPLAVITTSLPDGATGQAYNQQLVAGGGAAPYTWSVVGGSLPTGVSLAANGTLSGVPTAAGTSTFTVQVQDGANATDTQVLSLTVLPAPPASLTLTLSADNAAEVYVNGVQVGLTDDWRVAGVFSVPLQPGANVVAVKATDLGGAAGLLADLAWDGQTAGTSSTWKVFPNAPPGWEGLGFDDSTWANATSYGAYGVAPWLLRVVGFPTNTLAQWIWTNDNQNIDLAYFRFIINIP